MRQAQEEGAQAALSQITVVVTDVDDQKPVFSQEAIAVQVPEDIGKCIVS